VVYVGGQTDYDVERGYGLEKGRIYEVLRVGTRYIYGQNKIVLKLLRCLMSVI
jgi:hypothetical protein